MSCTVDKMLLSVYTVCLNFFLFYENECWFSSTTDMILFLVLLKQTRAALGG